MSQHETWQDWHPDHEAVLTIDEVVGRVQERGHNVAVSAIRYWQRMGILPYPIKEWRGSATSAYYPEIAVGYIVAIREWNATPAVEQLRKHLSIKRELTALDKLPARSYISPLRGHEFVQFANGGTPILGGSAFISGDDLRPDDVE